MKVQIVRVFTLLAAIAAVSLGSATLAAAQEAGSDPVLLDAVDEALWDDFLARPNCGKTVRGEASEDPHLLGCFGTPCDDAKKKCEEALKNKCDVRCKPPSIDSNLCDSKKQNGRIICQATCKGTCGQLITP